MKRFLFVTLAALTLAAPLAFATSASAAEYGYSQNNDGRGDYRQDRQDFRSDRHDLRNDRRDLRSDHRQLRNDRHDMRWDRRDGENRGR